MFERIKMFHAIRLAKVVYISLLAFSTRSLLSPSSSVENTQKAATMNQINIKKNIQRARHRYQQRRALSISDYLLLTVPLQHLEATKFIDELEEKYPHKKDMRTTPEFRLWQRNQMGINTHKPSTNKQTVKKSTRGDTQKTLQQGKEMVLNVPLLNATRWQEITQSSPATRRQEIPQPTPPVNPEVEECGITSIFDEITDQDMDRLMKDINEDPFLKSILDEFDVYEEIIDEGNVSDIDIDIDIGHLTPLDEEMNNLF